MFRQTELDRFHGGSPISCRPQLLCWNEEPEPVRLGVGCFEPLKGKKHIEMSRQDVNNDLWYTNILKCAWRVYIIYIYSHTYIHIKVFDWHGIICSLCSVLNGPSLIVLSIPNSKWYIPLSGYGWSQWYMGYTHLSSVQNPCRLI